MNPPLLAHAGGTDEAVAVALLVAVLAWRRWRLRRDRFRSALDPFSSKGPPQP